MKLGDLLENVGTVATTADPNLDITGVSCNSTATNPGDLFVAIKGYKTDGHSYIDEALKKGAKCVICQSEPKGETNTEFMTKVPHVIVEDTRKALAAISAAYHQNPAKRMKIIGVTGTNGKTTVTHLIKHIIERSEGKKVGLIGTITNLIGDEEIAATLTTPDSLELHRMFGKMEQAGCTYVVMEVSSHALCLHRVYGLEFEAGVFTNLTSEHMDFHSTMEDYASAKAILFQNSKNSIINIDDQYAQIMIDASRGKVTTYALKKKADLSVKEIKFFHDKTNLEVEINEQNHHARINTPGTFSAYNALAAMAVGAQLGYELSDIVSSLDTCPPVKGRAEVVQVGEEFNVMIDYAHTPDALKNIIATAHEVTTGRVVTLFGCGGDRDKAKRPLMGKIATEMSDITIVTSDNPRTEKPESIILDILKGVVDLKRLREEGRLISMEDRREAIHRALDILRLGDMLVIAGKGHETYQIIGSEKRSFDDREVVYAWKRNKEQNR